MQVEEIIERVAELCRKYSAKEALLFGSRAKGTALERSDIDIAVSGAADFEAMCEEVDNFPTLYKVDIVNMDKCGNGLLLEDIRKYGKKIYEKVSVL
ncbi:MAG: nucleotidyltransferase domain-containing protein [Clostridium sp.]|nr:nucleotidyltransferase domain-containing protein [Clostridium sp.]